MNEFFQYGLIIGEAVNYEFENKKYVKFPVLLGDQDEKGNFNDKAIVGVCKGESLPIPSDKVKFGTKIFCKVSVKSYDGKTTYNCSNVELRSKTV